MKTANKSLIQIHIAVFLFGLSGIFGKVISLPPLFIVLGRVFFSSIFLFIVIIFLKQSIRLKRKMDYWYLFLMGFILAVHWVSFFKAIQISTVAIALLTFSTFPIFTTLLEPYVFREKIKAIDMIIAIVTLLGVILIIPSFQLEHNLTQGAFWGVVSGATYAVLSILNKKYVKNYSSLVVAFYEQLIAMIILLPSIFVYKLVISVEEVVLLSILGVVFTAISHLLFINSLRGIKAQKASVISSLEPVYGIIFSILLLREIPSVKEIIGGVIILTAALYSTLKN